MNRFIAPTIAALFLTSMANAQIYQWKDESGKTIISDKPPVGAVRQQRKLESETTTSTTAAPQKTAADRDLEFRKRQKDSQEKATKNEKEQSSANEKKQFCESTRRHLQTLESGERIGMRDEKGERYFLEDTQREQEIAKLRQSMQTNCN